MPFGSRTPNSVPPEFTRPVFDHRSEVPTDRHRRTLRAEWIEHDAELSQRRSSAVIRHQAAETLSSSVATLL